MSDCVVLFGGIKLKESDASNLHDKCSGCFFFAEWGCKNTSNIECHPKSRNDGADVFFIKILGD